MTASLSRARKVAVLAATLAGMAVTAALGNWQLDRAARKEALQRAYDERSAMPPLQAAALARDPDGAMNQHYRRAVLEGRWVDGATVYLDNRQMDGRPGFFVVTPLKLLDSDAAVLVQRGWAPRDQADRTRVPVLPHAGKVVRIAGQVVGPPGRLFEFSAAASGPIRQNLDLAAAARETGLRLLPMSVLQEEPTDPDDGLLRHWPRPAVDVQKHYGYAFQWLALCALMAGLYVWFQLVRPRLARRA